MNINVKFITSFFRVCVKLYNYELGILILKDQLKNKLYDTNLYI